MDGYCDSRRLNCCCCLYIKPSRAIKEESIGALLDNTGETVKWSGWKTLHSRLISQRVVLLCPRGCSPLLYGILPSSIWQRSRTEWTSLFICLSVCVYACAPTRNPNEVKRLDWQSMRAHNCAFYGVVAAHSSHFPWIQRGWVGTGLLHFLRGQGHRVASFSLHISNLHCAVSSSPPFISGASSVLPTDTFGDKLHCSLWIILRDSLLLYPNMPMNRRWQSVQPRQLYRVGFFFTARGEIYGYNLLSW